MSDNKNKIDYELLRELAQLIKDAELGEIELEHDGLKIRMARPTPIINQVAMAPIAAAPVAVAAPALAAGMSIPAEAGADAGVHPGSVRSPMVGTAYLAAEPGAEPFVRVGDTIKEGQPVVIVEAMKTMNQIPSHKSGTVTAILVEDGQPVEYGEALIVVE